ncbi:MAG: hypothetical protein M3140_11475, partial [Actinomycetota bacterium]|nr:hypothetical protein [Actinomycetota bacterium]
NEDIRGPIGMASTNSAAYVSWPDTRATTASNSDAEDAYFSRVRFADPAPLGADTSGSSGWAWGLGGGGRRTGDRRRGAVRPAQVDRGGPADEVDPGGSVRQLRGQGHLGRLSAGTR